MSYIQCHETTLELDVDIEYVVTPGSRGYRTLAEGQLEPDSEPEVEILRVFLINDGAILNIVEHLPDEVLQELAREIECTADLTEED